MSTYPLLRESGWICLALLGSLTWPAMADEYRGATSVTQSVRIEPLLTSPIGNPTSSPAGAIVGSQTVTQTMLWRQRQGWAVGLGVQERALTADNAVAAEAAPVREASVLAGVSLATSERTRLIVQTPLSQPGASGWQNELAQSPPGRVHMAFELRPRDPYADLRRGFLLRVEVSPKTFVSLKPQGGQVGVVLSRKW